MQDEKGCYVGDWGVAERDGEAVEEAGEAGLEAGDAGESGRRRAGGVGTAGGERAEVGEEADGGHAWLHGIESKGRWGTGGEDAALRRLVRQTFPDWYFH